MSPLEKKKTVNVKTGKREGRKSRPSTLRAQAEKAAGGKKKIPIPGKVPGALPKKEIRLGGECSLREKELAIGPSRQAKFEPIDNRPLRLHGRPIPQTASDAVRELEFLYEHDLSYIISSIVQTIGGKKTCFGIGMDSAARLIEARVRAYFEDVGHVPDFELTVMRPNRGLKISMEIFACT